MGNFLLQLLLHLLLLFCPTPQAPNSNPSFQAQNPVPRPKSHTGSSKFQPKGPNPSPKAHISIARGRRKFPMCESIGHQPLWSYCPAPSPNFNHNLHGQGTGTAEHLTLLRLFFFFAFLFLSFIHSFIYLIINSWEIQTNDSH